MSTDTLIREVDEELRRDRLRKAWRQFGPWVIGGAVAVVLAVAVYEGWTWWQKSQAAKSSDQFYAATTLAAGTDAAAAQKALDDVIAQGSGGYPMLAQFREAALLAQQGKIDDAVKIYDTLASSLDNTHLRGLALLQAGYALVDKGDVAAVQQRVGGLISPGEPLRNSAREALGLVQYKAGKLDDAMATFQAIMTDPLADQTVQGRVQVYVTELTAEGAKAPAPVKADATVSGADQAVSALQTILAPTATPSAEPAAPASGSAAPTAPASAAPATASSVTDASDVMLETPATLASQASAPASAPSSAP
jgi:hypothetical protein